MNDKETKNEENKIIKENAKEKVINNNSNIIEEKYLLPPKSENKIYLKTLVLDLDETLAHGQNMPFASIKNQIILQCKINKIDTNIYVKIRPGVKEFLRKMSKIYEIIIFTASIEEYAKPLVNLIDQKNFCSYKLYREHCIFDNDKNAYIKDLKKLGRDLKDVIILDNSPNSYILNKENGLPISTWFDDEDDRELYNIIQILEFLSDVDDVRAFIPKFVMGDEISYFASVDIIRKFKNKNAKNNNMSAINFHPFMNDSNIKNRILTEVDSHSIIAEKINIDDNNNSINEENNKEQEYSISKFNKDSDKKEKEKDLIDISENIFDDIMLNENINRTDFDIRINDDLNILNNESIEKIDEKDNKSESKEEERTNCQINNDIKNNDEKENNIKENKEKNDNNTKDNKEKNVSKKKANINPPKKENKINKSKAKNKAKINQKNNNNIRKIKHIKSSSYVINTISGLNLLMPNQKSKKDNLSKNKNNLDLTIKNIKSKTVRKPMKHIHDEKTKKKFYRPRNIITDFKPLTTLNNSVIHNNLRNKIQSKLNTISNSPKKIKKNDKNKIKNRIQQQISKSKEKKEKNEKEKIKSKEESKMEETIKEEKESNNYNKTEINKKEIIKHRKKTPFRIKKKKEKNSNINNIINISIKKEPEKEKEKENKIIEHKNKINDNLIEKNKKESSSSLKKKDNNEIKITKTIINNHKAAKSTKNFHVNKKIENRLPWGWGGYTLKLSDLDNLFNYNVESREIRIAKLDINIFQRAKSYKIIKKVKNKVQKDSKDNDTKKKRGISSSNSTNVTFNKTENNKD